MGKILVLLLAGIATLTCGLDFAAAMSHEHHSNQYEVVSPFEGKPTLPNHCELQGHSLKNPCPHLLRGSRNKKSIKDTISVDCSGSQKYPGFSGAKKNEVFSSNKNLSGSSASFAFHFSYDLILYFLPPPLYHPPRFI
jgi:hypothetical protein